MNTILNNIITKHYNFELSLKENKIYCEIMNNLDDYLNCYKHIKSEDLDERILIYYDDKPIHCVKQNTENKFALSAQTKIFELLNKIN